MKATNFFALLIVAATTTAEAQKPPALRTSWDLHMRTPDAKESIASMNPQGDQFPVGIWTCRYAAPTSFSTPAGARTFHTASRTISCRDAVGLVELSGGCDKDAPAEQLLSLTLGRVADPTQMTTITMRCRTEVVP